VSTRAGVILRKELIDNLRDRRSVATALFYALMGPLLLIPLLGFESRSLDHGSAKMISIAASGAERAPGLVEYLRQRNIEVHPAPADPAQAVRDLATDLVLVIPPEYADDFRAGRPATVRIVTDHSRTTAAGEIGRVTGALGAYSDTVGALRLVARGVSPTVVSAIAVAVDDVATPESEGALLLGIVPIFLMTSLFLGGVYVAVDVTAGERERGSLEPLMSTPLTAREIVLGKLGAVLFFALSTMFVTLVGFAIVINLPFPEIPGMRFRLGASGTLAIFLTLVPLLLPVASLQMVVASRSRTVKEAFTAASVCSMIPMIPGLFLIFSPFKSTTAAMAIPVFGQNVIMNQVLRAGPLHAIDYVVAAVTATALGIVLAALAVATCAHARMLSDR
jgi:sodium transport system permease protein